MNTPISLAALLERFFTQRLMQQRQASLTPSVLIFEAPAHSARRWLESAKRDFSPAYPLSCVDEVISLESSFAKKRFAANSFPTRRHWG